MKLSSNLYQSKNTQEKAKGMAVGILLGGFAGGLTGATLGLIEANQKVKSLPVESVTVKKKEPIYQQKEIGKIPQDQYIPYDTFFYYSTNATPTKPVYEKVPLKDEKGNVIYREYEQTFQGHGKPIVINKTSPVKEPIFQGYEVTMIPDEKEVCMYDNNGYEKCTTILKGHHVRYYPIVKKIQIDTITVPEVRFETGVSYLKHAIIGGLIGAGTGSVIGGIVGAILGKLLGNDEE